MSYSSDAIKSHLLKTVSMKERDLYYKGFSKSHSQMWDAVMNQSQSKTRMVQSLDQNGVNNIREGNRIGLGFNLCVVPP